MYSLGDEYLRFERRDVRFNTNPRSVGVCVTTQPQILVSPTPSSLPFLMPYAFSLSLFLLVICNTDFLPVWNYNTGDNVPSRVWNPSARYRMFHKYARGEDDIPSISLAPWRLLSLFLRFFAGADSFIAFLARKHAASRRKDCGFARKKVDFIRRR